MRIASTTPRTPRTPPRYQRSGLAAEALRRALRQRVSYNMYGDMPGGLNDRQKAKMQDRVQTRLGVMQRNQPKLGDINPVLKKLFLRNRQSLTKNNWQPKGNEKPFQPARPEQPGNSPVGGPDSPGMSGLAPPHIKINQNGQLDLPYDFNFGMDVINAQEDMNRELQDLQSQDQQQNLEYEMTKRNAGLDYQDLARQSLNNFAGRGMAFSSGYGNQVARNATNFNNFLGDLEQSNTLFDQDIMNRRNGLEVAFNNMLRQAGYGQAKKFEQGAGNLGYGQGSADPSYDKTPVIGRPKQANPKKPKKKVANKYKGRLKKARKDGKVTAKEMKRLSPKQKQIVRKSRRRRRAN